MRRVTVYEGREPLFYETNIRDSAVSQVQAFSVAPLLGPHWPTSRINPVTTSQGLVNWVGRSTEGVGHYVFSLPNGVGHAIFNPRQGWVIIF